MLLPFPPVREKRARSHREWRVAWEISLNDFITKNSNRLEGWEWLWFTSIAGLGRSSPSLPSWRLSRLGSCQVSIGGESLPERLFPERIARSVEWHECQHCPSQSRGLAETWWSRDLCCPSTNPPSGWGTEASLAQCLSPFIVGSARPRHRTGHWLLTLTSRLKEVGLGLDCPVKPSFWTWGGECWSLTHR